MAISWLKPLPRWEGEIIEPPEAKKTEGWLAGDKPPAKWWNWYMNWMYEAVNEQGGVIEGLDTQLAQITQQKNDITTTVFNLDGSITETTKLLGVTKKVKTITFPSSTQIVETTVAGGVTTTNTTTFNPDGSIESEVS